MKLNTLILAAVVLVVTALYIGHVKVQCDNAGGVLVGGVIGYECVKAKPAK